MKRVAIIGTVGVPGRYGGFETLAHHLVDQLSERFDLKVYCSTKAYTKKERVKHFKGARLHYVPFNANGIQSVIYDFISIIHALFVADTLIVLGVSGGLIFPFVRLFTRKKLIVNIDGLEWRRDKWNPMAKAFLKFSERIAVKFSHADITDNEMIKRYTSITYKTLSHLIEYGGDHVMQVGPVASTAEKYPFIYEPYAFKVARIEPENNIHMVLEAFAKLKKRLVIVGNWDNSEYGRKLKNDYGSLDHIEIYDPIYDQQELDILRSNCLMYIHGHSAGGTNPSLVEAMNLSLPIIVFDCSYNIATTEDKTLKFSTVQELVDTVEDVTFTELMSMRTTMREIAQDRYTWDVIASKYAGLINSFNINYSKRSLDSDLSKLGKKFLEQRGLAHLAEPIPYYTES